MATKEQPGRPSSPARASATEEVAQCGPGGAARSPNKHSQRRGGLQSAFSSAKNGPGTLDP